MKIFKHNTKALYGISIKKKYLRLAATYRRFSDRRNPYWDFSLNALVECFNHETHGSSYSKNNGYINGKWMKDLTLSMWVEDLKLGNSVKAELYTAINKWWAIPALTDCQAGTCFAWLHTNARELLDTYPPPPYTKIIFYEKQVTRS